MHRWVLALPPLFWLCFCCVCGTSSQAIALCSATATYLRPKQVDAALLKATELRLAGNSAAMGGDFRRALDLYTVGLEMEVSGLGAGGYVLACDYS